MLLGADGEDDDADLRVEVLGALMIGLTFVRYVLGVSALSDAPPEAVTRIVVPLLRASLAPRAE